MSRILEKANALEWERVREQGHQSEGRQPRRIWAIEAMKPELQEIEYEAAQRAVRDKGKFKVLCDARRECYTYLHQKRGWSTPQIGGFFNRDHSTIVWWLDNQGSLDRKRERNRRRAQTEKLSGARRVA